MKKLLFLIPAVVISLIAKTPPINPVERLHQFLNNKDFFRLRTDFNNVKYALFDHDRLYFEAFVNNAFNACEKSARAVDSLLSSYHHRLNDSAVSALLNVQMDNYSKSFNYKRAAQIGDSLTAFFPVYFDSTTLAGVKNSTALWKALADVAPQEIYGSTTTIPWKRDKAGLMTIKVNAGGIECDFVFDTGANLSTISESYAERLGLQKINKTIDLGSTTSISTKASLAVARSIRLGDIELRNVVFLVLPDKQLAFPQISYTIDGIIGFPVMNQLEEIHIMKAFTMSFFRDQRNGSLKNLSLHGLAPVISLRTDTDTLSFGFDTGAKESELYHNYYDKHKIIIDKQSKAADISRGGVGGFEKISAVRVQSFNMYVGDKTVRLKDMTILTQPVKSREKTFLYGNIGQDLINKFDKMVIDFKEMYIDFL